MFKIDNASSTTPMPTPGGSGVSPDSWFQETDPAGGTIVTADWLNAVQGELANAIIGLGGTLNKASVNQLDIQLKAYFEPAFSKGTAFNKDFLSGGYYGTATTPARSDHSHEGMLPVGSVIAFTTSSPPTGFLECDGSPISRTTFADLFGIISDDYGAGDTTTTFNIPNYQGEFLRGWANGSANDPDRASRTDRGDGTIGDYVGTKQGWQNESHNHIMGNQLNTVQGASAGDSMCDYTTGVLGSYTTTLQGGNQANPINTNVMYCIKY